jgi:superfamily I DNA and/or RNA helicase
LNFKKQKNNKHKHITHKTPKSLHPNIKAFQVKDKAVRLQTQRGFSIPFPHLLRKKKKKGQRKKTEKNPPKSVSLQSILQSIHKHLSHADTTCFNWQETFPPALAFGR